MTHWLTSVHINTLMYCLEMSSCAYCDIQLSLYSLKSVVEVETLSQQSSFRNNKSKLPNQIPITVSAIANIGGFVCTFKIIFAS